LLVGPLCALGAEAGLLAHAAASRAGAHQAPCRRMCRRSEMALARAPRGTRWQDYFDTFREELAGRMAAIEKRWGSARHAQCLNLCSSDRPESSAC
jgi:hypothetical protein